MSESWASCTSWATMRTSVIIMKFWTMIRRSPPTSLLIKANAKRKNFITRDISMLILHSIRVFCWRLSSTSCKNLAQSITLTDKFHSQKKRKMSSRLWPSFIAYVNTTRSVLRSCRIFSVPSLWGTMFSLFINTGSFSADILRETSNSNLSMISFGPALPLLQPTLKWASQEAKGNRILL